MQSGSYALKKRVRAAARRIFEVERQDIPVLPLVPQDDDVSTHEAADWVGRSRQNERASSLDGYASNDSRGSLSDVLVTSLCRRLDETRQIELLHGPRLTRPWPGLAWLADKRERFLLTADNEVTLIRAGSTWVIERCPVEARPQEAAARRHDA